MDGLLGRIRGTLELIEERQSALETKLAELAVMRDDEEVIQGARPYLFHREGCSNLPLLNTDPTALDRAMCPL
jgi:hypothetical protein